MTGKDIIIYILQNNLENQEILKDGKLAGFMTVEDAAVKFNAGVNTIKAWFSYGYLDGFQIGDGK